MPEITRHFTVTTYIVQDGAVLLHLHKKLDMILPVGGHIDRDETPEEAAMREAKEESGLDVVLVDTKEKVSGFLNVQQLISPMYMTLQDINEHHQHIDMGFVALADSRDVQPGQGESNNFHWYTREELSGEVDKMPANVKVLALEALDIIERLRA